MDGPLLQAPDDAADGTAEEAAEPRAHYLWLTGFLCIAPVAAVSHRPGLAIVLLVTAGIGLFLLRRASPCPSKASPLTAGWAEVERVLKVVLVLIGIGLSVFACYLYTLPWYGGGRMGANSSAAIATLRNLAAAQAECRASGTFDRDRDGVGEFAFFAELAGGRGLRPPLLPEAFARVHARPQAPGGVVRRSGYVFQMFLPDADGAGIPEDPTGGGGTRATDPQRSEREWCCYAWPCSYGNSGKHAFFVNQDGVVLMTRNRAFYSGNNRSPRYDAAFARRAGASLASSIAANTSGRDGQVWATVH